VVSKHRFDLRGPLFYIHHDESAVSACGVPQVDPLYIARQGLHVSVQVSNTERFPNYHPRAWQISFHNDVQYLLEIASTDDGFEDQGILLGVVSYLPLSQTCRFEQRVYGILVVRNFWKPRNNLFPFQYIHRRQSGFG
jgi:hypothetical protein